MAALTSEQATKGNHVSFDATSKPREHAPTGNPGQPAFSIGNLSSESERAGSACT